MKLMVTWRAHPGKLQETLGVFARMSPKDEKQLMGKNLKLVGRWHDLVRGGGVAIFETDDPSAFSAYAMRWSGTLDLQSAVVLDDDEARAIGRQQ